MADSFAVDLAQYEDLLLQEQIFQAQKSLFQFVLATSQDYQPGWLHRDICDKLQRFSDRVLRKESPRLILTVPPRHGKSSIASQRFPIWHWGREMPEGSYYRSALRQEVILASYGQDLADEFSRQAQDVMQSAITGKIFPELRMHPKFSGIQLWKNSRGGIFKPVGIGGPTTGRGAHVFIVDDPIKDYEEAVSELARKRVWDWYGSVAQTRLAPGAGIIVIQTRWHHDDLVGRLLEAMAAREGDEFEVINYPAIAENDELYRKKGEALHEDRYPLSRLLQLKRPGNLGPSKFEALYQQNPTPEEGGVIKIHWFDRYNESPELLYRLLQGRVFQSWDTAHKDKETNDPSACLTWLESDDGRVYILDIECEHFSYPKLKARVVEKYYQWGAVALLIEDKGSGQDLIQDLRNENPEINTLARESGNQQEKVVRAMSCTLPIESKRVLLPREADWLEEFEQEVKQFPNGKHDDRVDAMVVFLRWWMTSGFAVPYAESVTTNFAKAVQIETAGTSSPPVLSPVPQVQHSPFVPRVRRDEPEFNSFMLGGS